MSITVILANDILFAEACGVDLLDGFAGIGGGMAIDMDAAAFGGNSLLADLAMTGADSMAIEALAETGTDGDGAPILVGATATDTLRAALDVTGRDAAFAEAAAATGTNHVWIATLAPAISFDMSYLVARTVVGFHTGLAA